MSQSMAGTAEREARSTSVTDLLKDLRDESTRLIRQEVALAKTELSEKASRITKSTAVSIGGLLVALIGATLIFQAISALLAVWLAETDLGEHAIWLAPLIVGTLVAIIGALVARNFMKKIKGEHLVPEKTIDSLKRDKEWIQNKVR